MCDEMEIDGSTKGKGKKSIIFLSIFHHPAPSNCVLRVCVCACVLLYIKKLLYIEK